ncbi:hypothetical protein M758_9G015100 [Ceratodon purpureus]|nr:hypothetical protein M758_9G015100 [Ceratodon purpureus]
MSRWSGSFSGKCSRIWMTPASPCDAPQNRRDLQGNMRGLLSVACARPDASTASTMGPVMLQGTVSSPTKRLMKSAAYKNPTRPLSSSHGSPAPSSAGPIESTLLSAICILQLLQHFRQSMNPLTMHMNNQFTFPLEKVNSLTRGGIESRNYVLTRLKCWRKKSRRMGSLRNLAVTAPMA